MPSCRPPLLRCAARLFVARGEFLGINADLLLAGEGMQRPDAGVVTDELRAVPQDVADAAGRRPECQGNLRRAVRAGMSEEAGDALAEAAVDGPAGGGRRAPQQPVGLPFTETLPDVEFLAAAGDAAVEFAAGRCQQVCQRREVGGRLQTAACIG